MTNLLAHLSAFVTHVISSGGYFGVGILMALESAAIPLPSEVIMPFAGYLVSIGTFTLLGISLAGAIGSVIGSAILYGIGYYGGRPLIEKYGKYILIRSEDLDSAERFFKKYGVASNFIGRMLPVVRTFISFPAGVAKVDVKKFLFYSFVGSFIWSLFLGYIGLKLGQNWDILHKYFRGLDYVIVTVVVIGVVWYVYRHFKKRPQ
jgi:membrane protein DedA with SNARE-associated domain